MNNGQWERVIVKLFVKVFQASLAVRSSWKKGQVMKRYLAESSGGFRPGKCEVS